MITPLENYQNKIDKGLIVKDLAQEEAIKSLNKCYKQIVETQNTNRISRIFNTKSIKGLYLYGDVGRGKTLLMDIFFDTLPIKKKLRLHFHRFMALVHNDLNRFKNKKNPLDLVAENLLKKNKVICFDEFSVSDIADAMILGNLFKKLFAKKMILIITSNIKPDNLYLNGLQRKSFLPAIVQIKKYTKTVLIESKYDYRLNFLEKANTYQYPINEENNITLNNYFSKLATNTIQINNKININGRDINTKKVSDSVIWFDFKNICDGPRSQNDYIEIAKCYKTVIISDIPIFTQEYENQARRFIALIDEFYDRKIKVIISAEATIEKLYDGSKLKAEFKRTVSRLHEMQSYDYLSKPFRQ